MFASSFIARTGQRWKMAVPLLVSSIAGAVIYLQRAISPRLGPHLTVVLVLGAALVGLASFLLPCVLIRCPRCKGKLFWLAVSRQEASGWLPWLLGLESCPQCGFSPARTEHAA
jgi:hypothetical protein